MMRTFSKLSSLPPCDLVVLSTGKKYIQLCCKKLSCALAVRNRLYEFLAKLKACVGSLSSFYQECHAKKTKMLMSLNKK